MIYTVLWTPSAERCLTDIWINATDRQAVTDAANAIDNSLRNIPLEVGESRDGNIRILTIFPLSVYYDVRDEDRVVSVWAVWQFAKQ